MSNWNDIRIYHDGDSYFKELKEKILQSQKEITFECYIFSCDAIGTEILASLAEAAKRGVRVRLLVDGIGSWNWLDQIQEECQKKSIQFKIYKPLSSLFSWALPYKWIHRVNRRNHRKVITIDHNEAFVGSRNIEEVHSEKHFGTDSWYDCSIYLKGHEVQWLKKAFEQAWKNKWLRKWSNSIIKLNLNRKLRLAYKKELIKWIKSAQKRIFITNPYFVPKRKVLASLKRAARRGVDVRICLPQKSDVTLVKWASQYYIGFLLKSKARVYEFLPSVLHAKWLIIDDIAIIGSSNLNHRSLMHDLEVDVVFNEPEVVQNLSRRWLVNESLSQEITYNQWKAQPLYKRILHSMALWLKYWL